MPSCITAIMLQTRDTNMYGNCAGVDAFNTHVVRLQNLLLGLWLYTTFAANIVIRNRI